MTKNFGACSHLGMENCEAAGLTVSSPDWTKSMASLREEAVNLLLFVTLGVVSDVCRTTLTGCFIVECKPDLSDFY